MRYVIAAVACIGLFIVYVSIGVSLGWRHGGGYIPMSILFATVGLTWAAITRRAPTVGTGTVQPPQPRQPLQKQAAVNRPKENQPFAGFQDLPATTDPKQADNTKLLE